MWITTATVRSLARNHALCCAACTARPKGRFNCVDCLTVAPRAEPVRFDSSGKPLNNAAQRQVQRERSERERKRSTVWIAVSLVVAAAVLGLLGALWVWRRRRNAAPSSDGGFSYHNPAADLGERYFSTQYSGSDYSSVPPTGAGKPGMPLPPPPSSQGRTGSGGKPPIMIYDNSYLTHTGNEVRSCAACMLRGHGLACPPVLKHASPAVQATKPFFANQAAGASGAHRPPMSKQHSLGRVRSSGSTQRSASGYAPPLPASQPYRPAASAMSSQPSGLSDVPRPPRRKASAKAAPSLPLGCPPSFMRDAHKPGSIPSYGTGGASRGLGGASRATTVLSGGLTVATESPYQAVDSAMEESMSAMSAHDDPDTGGVDLDDPLAVLHAQLDYYEKYRGGVVLANYRCVYIPAGYAIQACGVWGRRV